MAEEQDEEGIPFRVVLMVPYEFIVYAEDEQEAEDAISEALANGDEELQGEILENGLPLNGSLLGDYNENKFAIGTASPEDEERILGTADPQVEAEVEDEDAGGDTDEPEDDDDGDDDEGEGGQEPGGQEPGSEEADAQ